MRQVLDMVNEILDDPVAVETGPRHVGDVGRLVADAGRVGEVLNWKPQHGDLRTMIDSALAWEKKLQSEQAA